MTETTIDERIIVDALYLPQFPHCSMKVRENGTEHTETITPGLYHEMCRTFPVTYSDGGYVEFDTDWQIEQDEMDKAAAAWHDAEFEAMDEAASQAHWVQYGVL